MMDPVFHYVFQFNILSNIAVYIFIFPFPFK